MMQYKYTFLLPAFKIRYLKEALTSIQSQTFQDFKVIVSDDCSPEDVYSISKPFLADSRFSYRKNEKNIGGERLADHWNLLLNLCDTEYLIMASDDDIYAPTFLEEIEKLLNKHPEVDMARARVAEMSVKDGIILSDGLYEECVSDIEYLKQQYTNTNIGCIGNFVFRTKMLKEKGGFVNFPYAWFSDDATVIMMAEKGCVNTKEVLFQFRVSDISISYGKNTALIAKNKILAALQYDSWVRNYVKRYERSKQASVHRIMAIFYEAQQQWMEFHVTNNIYNCSWNDFWKLCPLIKQHYIVTCAIKMRYLRQRIASFSIR
jgi:glycosyltransferase involved in cell wall biosynthesis